MGYSHDRGGIVVKTYAAFVRNVLDPMLDKAKDVLDHMEKRGYTLNIGKLFVFHIVTFIIEWIFRLAVCAMICWTVIKVL